MLPPNPDTTQGKRLLVPCVVDEETKTEKGGVEMDLGMWIFKIIVFVVLLLVKKLCLWVLQHHLSLVWLLIWLFAVGALAPQEDCPRSCLPECRPSVPPGPQGRVVRFPVRLQRSTCPQPPGHPCNMGVTST